MPAFPFPFRAGVAQFLLLAPIMRAGAVIASEKAPVAPAGIGEEDIARASLYRLIAALLARPPDQELLDSLRALDTDAAHGTGMAAPWAILKQSAASTAPTSLAEEYQDLFIGIARGELVPYGSWYLTGFLMEKPLAELRRDLARLGFARREDVGEPEDHAAALFEVMHLLIGEGGVDFDQQREFFHKHLAPWIGRFFADLAQAPSARFYRAVALFGEQFMALERSYFSMAV